MTLSVSKNSSLTASFRAKQLQPNFPRFCQTELKKFVLRKLSKLIKMQKKPCSLRYQARVVIDVITNRYMLQKPNVWQVKFT